MVAGMDRYFQIVKCFRDEDLRADRQPEFTQVDCEMSFVERDDILTTFEGLAAHLFDTIRGVKLPLPFRRMSWEEAMSRYGSDKPDLRFGMEIQDVTEQLKGKGMSLLDEAAYSGAIVVAQKASYSRKQLDALTEFVKKPQVGAHGLIWIKLNEDGTCKSTIDKFFPQETLQSLANDLKAKQGDLILVLTGAERYSVLKQLGTLRLHIADLEGMKDPNRFECLYVVDFPLLEWDDETQRYYAVHHPFTAPKQSDIALLDSDPGHVKADAYDMVINGVEVGGGSIRIHDSALQHKMFELLGFGSSSLFVGSCLGRTLLCRSLFCCSFRSLLGCCRLLFLFYLFVRYILFALFGCHILSFVLDRIYISLRSFNRKVRYFLRDHAMKEGSCRLLAFPMPHSNEQNAPLGIKIVVITCFAR